MEEESDSVWRLGVFADSENAKPFLLSGPRSCRDLLGHEARHVEFDCYLRDRNLMSSVRLIVAVEVSLVALSFTHEAIAV